MNKFMKANKKIEMAVIFGYKAIEDGVIGIYQKVEDKFIEAIPTPARAIRMMQRSVKKNE